MLQKKSSQYELDLCADSILPNMLRFTIPLMCSGVLQLLFNAADIVVVGRYAGDTCLAAVGANTSLINLFLNMFIGLSVGANIIASRYYGAKDREAVRETVHTSMKLALVCGLAVTAVGVIGARTFLKWMQSPPEILDLAASYLRIYFLGMTATMFYNFGAALLRAVGDTKRPLYYLLFAGIVNVILNLFFVIVLDLDVVGVAMATAISQCISAFLVVRCLIHEQGYVHLDLKDIRFHKVRLKQILQTGLPAGLQGSLFALSNVVIQSSINSFGEIAIAGNTAAANLETFIYTAMNAFFQANISFTSANLGAGKVDRICPILYRALFCVFTVGMVLGGAAYAFGPQLLGIYSTSPEVVAAGMVRLSKIGRIYGICGLMDVIVGSLRGIGYSLMPMFVTLIGACGLRLLWLATIFQIPRFHTTEIIYLSYPISWSITFLVHVVCFIFAMRKLRRDLGTPD